MLVPISSLDFLSGCRNRNFFRWVCENLMISVPETYHWKGNSSTFWRYIQVQDESCVLREISKNVMIVPRHYGTLHRSVLPPIASQSEYRVRPRIGDILDGVPTSLREGALFWENGVAHCNV